ncbi:MAG: START domain-containing protein [Flavobacteriales bacterium]|jgi:ribosome-associated toxin RatA of RatAB toxin-antitoxin module|nr:START domain-containing protein [Flavobacteriales bacterium]
MKLSILIYSAILSIATIGSKDGEKWVRTTDRDGIVTYIGQKNAAGYKPTRATMTVAIPPEKIIEVLTDVDEYTNWVPECDVAKHIDKGSENTLYCYQVFSVPLIKDRNLVSQVSVTEDKGIYYLRITSKPERVKAYDESVRIQHFMAEYTITPLENGKTKLDMWSELNMDGIPAFLVNWVNESKPYDAFDRLRKQLNKI